MNKLSVAAAGAALFAFGTVDAACGAAIAPGNLHNIEGDANRGLPFNSSYFGMSSLRYQQVFAAKEFSSFTEPFLIAQILFRPDAAMGKSFSSTLPNISINLSTTKKAPDGLSTIFANNIGSDDKVVFNGPLSFSSTFTGGATKPKNFDIAINLATPFLYNPSAGNLLLDVRNFAGGFSTQFDAEDTFGDSISRVVSTQVRASRGAADTSGLVTKFITTAAVPSVPSKTVPEPASLLGILAVAAFGVTSTPKHKEK